MSKKKRKPFDWFSPDDEDWFRTPFSHVFEELKKQEDLFRELEKEQEELFRPLEKERKLPRWAIKPSKGEFVSGFSFSISSDGKHPPRIEVNRLGPKGWEPVREKAFGRIPIKEIKKPAELPAVSYPAQKAKPVAEVKPPVVYEEAPYTYSIDINQVTIELKISGVEKEENIELQFYPESLEIKAIVPKTKKGYFAVLKIPAQIDQENTEVKIEKDKAVIKIPRKRAMIRGEW